MYYNSEYHKWQRCQTMSLPLFYLPRPTFLIDKGTVAAKIYRKRRLQTGGHYEEKSISNPFSRIYDGSTCRLWIIRRNNCFYYRQQL